jgi:Putative F0F1-ATPase subunit Ca2+/Mg2+ transporter
LCCDRFGSASEGRPKSPSCGALTIWVTVTREPPGWSTLVGIGTVSAATLAAGIALGWWLDGLLHTSPILVLLGIALGLVGGVCYTVVEFRQFLKN